MNWIVLGLMTLAAAVQTAPDRLPRRGFFGVGLENVADGVRVTTVFPDSTAADMGIVPGDIITAVDERQTQTSDAVISALGRHRGGEAVTVRISRNGQRTDMPIKLKAYPAEKMPNATVTYGSVEALPGVLLRTITSVPVSKSLANRFSTTSKTYRNLLKITFKPTTGADFSPMFRPKMGESCRQSIGDI